MAASCIWRALPPGPSVVVPALLVSVDLGTSAYTIRVTDTANIWVESLDRKQICMRAWGENTSIDPSDTPENMHKFLDSLRSALDPSHEHHALTSMSLSPGGSSSDARDSLTLKITCELPGLSPLEWPVQLKKMSSTSLASDLVLPLIQGQDMRTREIQHLTDLLSQKDAVISRLLEKLESTGTGLENVFNALSSKKKVSRAVAESKVKGLAPFDKSSLHIDASSYHGPENITTLLTNVFGEEGLELTVASEATDIVNSENWWHDLKTTVHIPHRAQSSKFEGKYVREPSTPNTEREDEDDFQFQPSSPAPMPAKRATKDQDMDDVSTASESGEDEVQVKPSKPKTAAKPTGGRIGRLGGIGHRKEAEKQPSAPAPTIGKKEEMPEVDGSETATDASDEEGNTKARKSPPRQTKSDVPSRGKIGRIGVRNTTPASDRGQESSGSPRESTADEPKHSHAPKLGLIGKNAKKGSVTNAQAGDERGRNTDSQVAEPSHRETSIERADRRREELKRELEKKAAAGPTKKKRKF